MHSQIAAGRFVHLRGVYYARPLHPRDAGPCAVRTLGALFCPPGWSVRRSSPQARVAARPDPYAGPGGGDTTRAA